MALPTIPRGEMMPSEAAKFHKFANPPGNGGLGESPDLIALPDATINMALLVNMDLPLRDGGNIPMWIIRNPDDPVNGQTFPSPTARIPQGALVHADISSQGGSHTVHWHGIEPTPMNDGVGKHSMEANGHFIYQFQPRFAGTYFYHCHKNTVLHFEMGLYGMFIVDPPDPAAPGVLTTYPTGGPGFVARFNPSAVALTDHAIPYHKEAFWVADSMDSRWHTLGHNAFMQRANPDNPVDPATFSQDGFLHDFQPDIFVMTGIPRRNNDPVPFTADENFLFGPLVAPTVRVGETLLIRVLNADYITHKITLEIDAEVIAMDGRALGIPPAQAYSRPFALPAGTPFLLTSAMRWDLIVKPTVAGSFPATVDFLNQITGEKLYTATTTITVTP